MTKTIKSPVVSPLLILLTLRALRSAQGKLITTSDLWSRMPGLRLANPDPDRSSSNWLEAWPESTRKSLAEAWKDPLVSSSLLSEEGEGVDLGELAHHVGLSKEGDRVVWGRSVLDKNAVPSEARVVGWLLPEKASIAWPPRLLERWVEVRAQGAQAWVEVSASSTAQAWWNEEHVNDTVRWGASWWLSPPDNGSLDDYTVFLQAVSQRVISHPHINQWVWPWADLFQQAIEECMRTAVVSSRCGAPFAWPRRKADEWGKVRKGVWESARSAMGPQGLLEDILAGIALSAWEKGWRPEG